MSFQGSTVAPDSIAASFGAGLATSTLTATVGAPVTTLGGTTVTVSGFTTSGSVALVPAEILFVSPGQVNFVVPGNMAPGLATVTVKSPLGTAIGFVTIAPVAPGLASASQNGKGLAAATLVFVAADGTQTTTPLSATAVVLGSNPVYLALFGTGFRHAKAQPTVTIGAQSGTVSYSGVAGAGNVDGEDQINVLLPANLASGTLNVTVLVDGQTSNAVTITIAPAAPAPPPPPPPPPPPATPLVAPLATTSAISFVGSAVAPDSIAASFGADLATTTLGATVGTPVTTLGGTTVTVSGFTTAGNVALAPAELLFVSPGQVNFVVPSNMAPGLATVTVKSGDGTVSVGLVTIANVAPALSAASQNGQGLAAANLVRITADGTRTTETITAAPIVLGSDTCYLTLFGSGFRHASTTTVTIAGTTYSATYAGAAGAGNVDGADQVNVLLPANLASGTLQIQVVADGQTSNTVTITIQ